MSNYIVTDSELTSVANAIRTKGGTNGSLVFPGGFTSAIGNISGGGSSDFSTAEITFSGFGNDSYFNGLGSNTQAVGLLKISEQYYFSKEIENGTYLLMIFNGEEKPRVEIDYQISIDNVATDGDITAYYDEDDGYVCAIISGSGTITIS